MSIARPQLRRMVLGHGHFAGQVPVSAYFCSLKNLKDLTGCTCLDCLARSLSFASSAINLSCRSRTHVLGHVGMRVEGFQGLGFGVWGLGFRVQGAGFKVQGSGPGHICTAPSCDVAYWRFSDNPIVKMSFPHGLSHFKNNYPCKAVVAKFRVQSLRLRHACRV